MSREKTWEELTLDEKLTELGFDRDADEAAGDPVVDQRRMHAALDRLLDCGETLNAIEDLARPVGTGTGSGGDGDALNTLATIYELVIDDDEDEEDEDSPAA